MTRSDEVDYTAANARTINSWVDHGWVWGTPIDHEEYVRALDGDWRIRLTPVKTVPRSWYFPDMRGKRVLGLASGGGQQMPVFAAMGADCTVLDYAQRQLDGERAVAKREGYDICLVHADMTKPLPFDDESFDLICHPVSNCYVEHVLPVWLECHRVLKPGGRLLSGLDNGISYILDEECERVVGGLPYNPLRSPADRERMDPEEDGFQFSHTLEDQIRGQLRAGFTLVDCYEDTDAVGRLHDLNIPAFWATLAEKRAL